jgi:hypothetical protein
VVAVKDGFLEGPPPVVPDDDRPPGDALEDGDVAGNRFKFSPLGACERRGIGWGKS